MIRSLNPLRELGIVMGFWVLDAAGTSVDSQCYHPALNAKGIAALSFRIAQIQELHAQAFGHDVDSLECELAGVALMARRLGNATLVIACAVENFDHDLRSEIESIVDAFARGDEFLALQKRWKPRSQHCPPLKLTEILTTREQELLKHLDY